MQDKQRLKEKEKRYRHLMSAKENNTTCTLITEQSFCGELARRSDLRQARLPFMFITSYKQQFIHASITSDTHIYILVVTIIRE